MILRDIISRKMVFYNYLMCYLKKIFIYIYMNKNKIIIAISVFTKKNTSN